LTKLPRKTELPERVQSPGNEKADSFPTPDQFPVINRKWSLSYGIFPSGGSAVWLATLLHAWLSAVYQKLEKTLNFIATTKTVSIINIFLLLNLKHSSYWEGN